MDHVITMEKLFAESILCIPDYQRGYAWEEKHLTAFIEDIELLLDGKDHYTGTMVVLHEDADDGPTSRIDEEGKHYSTLAVVDGQQRLTTIVLLLDAIRREMAQIESLARLAEGIRKSYITVDDQGGQPIYKLRLNHDCHDFFIRNVLSDSPGPDGPAIQSHQRLYDARQFFTRHLSEQRSQRGLVYKDYLVSLRNKVVQHLKVTIYTVEEKEDVGVIFETLNDRGKTLSELEKVKNYLLYLASKLDVPQHQLAEEVNLVWTRIFERLMEAHMASSDDEDQLLRSHWLMAYDPQPKNWGKSKSIKEQFNLKEYQGCHKELLQELRKYTSSLRDASVAYCDAYKPTRTNAFAGFTQDPSLHKQIVRASEKLRRINVIAPFLPLLMAARLRFTEDAQKYLELVRLCEVFAFRIYRFSERRSNTGQSALFRRGHWLYSGEVDYASVLEGIRGWLLSYCSNDDFREGFKFNEDGTFNWYEWGGLKYFLYEYEEYLAKDDVVQLPWEALERTDRQESIEHILPQTPSDRYWTTRFNRQSQRRMTHDLGNLCLTLHNPYLSNKPFPEKCGKPGSGKPCYANSNLFMEKALTRFDDWNEAAILKRRKAMIAWALQHWHVDDNAAHFPDDGELSAGYDEE